MTQQQTIFTNEKPTRSLSEFDFVHEPTDKASKLGVGSFASVKLAKEKKTGKQYAIKIISMDPAKLTNSDLHNIRTEISVHRSLDHQNIVKFYDYIQRDNSVYFVLDYAPSGNLYSYIHKRKSLTPEDIFRFFYQTTLAVQYLHQKDILHRDLKPENLLLDKELNIKLCDFGWAARKINEKRTTFCGTYEYMAPEIVNKKHYDYRVDIWSLGILLYELLHREAPYKGRSLADVAKALTKPQILFKSTIHDDAKDLINKILKHDPNERLSIVQILSHPWVQMHLSPEQDESMILEHAKISPKQMKPLSFQSLDIQNFRREAYKSAHNFAKIESVNSIETESHPQSAELKSRRNISSLNTCASLKEIDFEREKTTSREKAFSITNTSASEAQRTQDFSVNRAYKPNDSISTSRGHTKSSSVIAGSIIDKLGLNEKKISQDINRKKKIFETTTLSPNLRSKVDNIILQLCAQTTSHKTAQSVFQGSMTSRNQNQQTEQNPTIENFSTHRHHTEYKGYHQYTKSHSMSKISYDQKPAEKEAFNSPSNQRSDLDVQNLKEAFQKRVSLFNPHNYTTLTSSASSRNLPARSKLESQLTEPTNVENKYAVTFKQFSAESQKYRPSGVLASANENRTKSQVTQEIDVSISKTYKEYVSKRKSDIKYSDDLEASTPFQVPCSVEKRNEVRLYKKDLLKDKENNLRFREECLSK